MARFKGWTHYVSEDGTFFLPRYLYESSRDSMKACLDFGTMAIEDKDRLRAFKESIKALFNKRWGDLAEALEGFGIIDPCVCTKNEFCQVCGGSRYQLNITLNADEVREVATFLAKDADPSVVNKLHEKVG